MSYDSRVFLQAALNEVIQPIDRYGFDDDYLIGRCESLKRTESIFYLGILLMVVGLIISSIGSVEEGGFVFIFPFFVLGGSIPTTGLVVFGILSTFLIIVMLSYSSLKDVGVIGRPRRTCIECGETVSWRATYCPRCGQRIFDDSIDEYQSS